MRVLGWLLVIFTVLYLMSWGCHDAAIAIGQSAEHPPQGFALLVHAIFGSLGVIVCGVLAIPYVLMHEGIANDTLFVCVVGGIGLVLTKFPRRAGAASSSHGH